MSTCLLDDFSLDSELNGQDLVMLASVPPPVAAEYRGT